MIPVTTAELASYTPPSLANLVGAPVFRFRPVDTRAKRKYRHALISEGLRYYGPEDIQAEILAALRGLWVGDPEQLKANETRLIAYWETVKQAEKDETVAVDPAEQAAIAVAIRQLADNWQPLRKMEADNIIFNGDAPKVALALFLAGWSGLDTPFRLEDGRVPMEAMDALETEIDAIEAKAIADGVDGVAGTAFVELYLHAMTIMGLVASAEKNSPAPSSPSDTPNGSTVAGSAPATTMLSASAAEPCDAATSSSTGIVSILSTSGSDAGATMAESTGPMAAA